MRLVGIAGLTAWASAACGGSTATEPNQDPNGLILQICSLVDTCPHDSGSSAECEADIQAQRDDSVVAGCGTQFDALLACLAQAPQTCDGFGEGPCASEQAASSACTGPAPTWQDECSQSMSGFNPAVDPPGYERCDAVCPTWALVCQRNDAASPMICTCTQGPKTGKSFQVDACVTPLEVAKDFCG